MIWAVAIGAYVFVSVKAFQAGYRVGYRRDQRKYYSLGHSSWHDEGIWIGSWYLLTWPVLLPVLVLYTMIIRPVTGAITPRMDKE